MKILIVEDDRRILRYLQKGLEEERWSVETAEDGIQGEQMAQRDIYDVVILDIRLPGKDGVSIVRSMRAKGIGVPVLLLTAQDAVESKVDGLRAGADDYLTKPFSFEELLARVEALARRPKQVQASRLVVSDLTLDPETHAVVRAGEAIEVTPKEFTVLEYLMRHPGRVMSRTLISEYAWDFHFDPGTNIVDVVINRLRKKVDRTGLPKLIHTVRGVGYVIREP